MLMPTLHITLIIGLELVQNLKMINTIYTFIAMMFHNDILGHIKMFWNIKQLHVFTHNLGLLKLEVRVASFFATSKMAIIELKTSK
jgi:hypothetical protein